VGIRGVFRDHNSLVMGFFSALVGIKDSNEAELLAIIKALKLSYTHDDFFDRNFIFKTGLCFYGKLDE
jgi:hypothetical protein